MIGCGSELIESAQVIEFRPVNVSHGTLRILWTMGVVLLLWAMTDDLCLIRFRLISVSAFSTCWHKFTALGDLAAETTNQNSSPACLFYSTEQRRHSCLNFACRDGWEQVPQNFPFARSHTRLEIPNVTRLISMTVWKKTTSALASARACFSITPIMLRRPQLDNSTALPGHANLARLLRKASL